MVPSSPLGLGALATWKDWLLWIDFNQDRLFLIDQEGNLAPCSPHLGDFPNEMEGAQTPYVSDDTLWVSFGLSGGLKEFDLTSLDPLQSQCTFEGDQYQPALGQLPNDLLANKEFVFVLDSATHDVWVYDRTSKKQVARWPIQTTTHPWHFVLSPNQQDLVITEWEGHALQWMSAQSGRLLKRFTRFNSETKEKTVCTGQWDSNVQVLGDEWGQLNEEDSQFIIDLSITKDSPINFSNVNQDQEQNQLTSSNYPRVALWVAPDSGSFKLEVSSNSID